MYNDSVFSVTREAVYFTVTGILAGMSQKPNISQGPFICVMLLTCAVTLNISFFVT